MGGDNRLRRRVEQIAGTLASVDGRYAEWADAVGVSVGETREPQKSGLIAELDGAVALLYGLNRDDVEQIYETFHVGWDYTQRLSRVLEHLGGLEGRYAEDVAPQRATARRAV